MESKDGTLYVVEKGTNDLILMNMDFKITKRMEGYKDQIELPTNLRRSSLIDNSKTEQFGWMMGGSNIGIIDIESEYLLEYSLAPGSQ